MAIYKTTTREIKETTPAAALYCCGYCDMQYLLHYQRKAAYTCGVYGWNYDVFETEYGTICTGYRGMPGIRLETEAAEKKAQTILHNSKLTEQQKKNKVNKLLEEVCRKAFNSYINNRSEA